MFRVSAKRQLFANLAANLGNAARDILAVIEAREMEARAEALPPGSLEK